MRSQQRAVPLADVANIVPSTLSNIVSKCIETDPAKRYQSAEQLDADLRAWQGRGGKSRVSASSVRLRMNRIQELAWQRLAVTGALILGIAAGIAWYVIRRQLSHKS